MTYAVAVRLQRGVVFAADTRTNAGIDNVAQFRKLHFWRRTGDRVLVLLTAGNLAVSQSVISIINEQPSPEAPTDCPTLMNVNSMYRAARLVGDAVREVRAIDGPSLDASKTGFSVSCILGGQVGDEAPRLFQIYDEGNFIEATDDKPYLQIGEHKYGKPILHRGVHPEMRLGEVAKLILLSFGATLRSNLSVGMPIAHCAGRNLRQIRAAARADGCRRALQARRPRGGDGYTDETLTRLLRPSSNPSKLLILW